MLGKNRSSLVKTQCRAKLNAQMRTDSDIQAARAGAAVEPAVLHGGACRPLGAASQQDDTVPRQLPPIPRKRRTILQAVHAWRGAVQRVLRPSLRCLPGNLPPAGQLLPPQTGGACFRCQAPPSQHTPTARHAVSSPGAVGRPVGVVLPRLQAVLAVGVRRRQLVPPRRAAELLAALLPGRRRWRVQVWRRRAVRAHQCVIHAGHAVRQRRQLAWGAGPRLRSGGGVGWSGVWGEGSGVGLARWGAGRGGEALRGSSAFSTGGCQNRPQYSYHRRCRAQLASLTDITAESPSR